MPYGNTRRRSRGRRKPAYDWTPVTIIGRVSRYSNMSAWDRSECTDLLATLLEPAYRLALLAMLPLLVAGYLAAPLLDRLDRRIRESRRKSRLQQEACRRSLRRKRIVSVRETPKPAQLLSAWEESRTSLAGKLLLGALLSEIEPHVDQSLIRDEGGHVVGRHPGIRGWIRLHCPELEPHYKTMMAYKALADKVQMAIGLYSQYSIVDVIDIFKEFGDSKAMSQDVNVPKAASGNVSGSRPTNNPDLEEPRKALLELLKALPRLTLRALDDLVRLRIGFPRMHRNGRRVVA